MSAALCQDPGPEAIAAPDPSTLEESEERCRAGREWERNRQSVVNTCVEKQGRGQPGDRRRREGKRGPCVGDMGWAWGPGRQAPGQQLACMLTQGHQEGKKRRQTQGQRQEGGCSGGQPGRACPRCSSDPRALASAPPRAMHHLPRLPRLRLGLSERAGRGGTWGDRK